MEPMNNEIEQSVPEDVVEKKKWITPEIKVIDIVNVTKSSSSSQNKHTDGSTAYS
jgi:hypothetical protein